MAALADLGLAVDLVAAPWAYPGPAAPWPGLSLGDRFEPLEPVPYQDRTPVLAVGCNAAPGVLHAKLAAGGATGPVPMVPATMLGLGIGHSAHVSIPGYVPATPYHAPGQRTAAVLLWLDAPQLATVDATEPTYRRRRLHAADHPLRVTAGPAPAAFHVYESVRGVLRGPDGAVHPLGPQAALQPLLRRAWPAGAFPADTVGRAAAVRLRDDAGLRAAVTAAFTSGASGLRGF